MPTLYDVNRAELAARLDGQPRYRLDQVWHGLYRTLAPPESLSNVPKDLRARLTADLPTALTEGARSVSDGGDTTKWLWELVDGARVETVLMHYDDRSTVCVSTQAGCAMGCGFCATGQAGYQRNLAVGEIVEQVIRAARQAAPRRVANVVFMGMGEPLANYDATWDSIRRLHHDVGLSARHLTVSTVGVIPGIRRLADEELPVNLAVSLHAANDTLRDELVPINRRYPLDELMDACRQYFTAKRRRLSFEWALIDGVNDRGRDAAELAALARPLRAHINLIPLNPTPGYATRGTPPERVAAFREQLERLGANAFVHGTRATEIYAACGQLRASTAADPRPVTVGDPEAR